MQRLIVVLLSGIILAGCMDAPRQVTQGPGGGGSTVAAQTPAPSPERAPTAVERQQAQQAAARSQPMVGNFPTSFKKETGEWRTLNRDSYKADFATTCRLLGLNKPDCDKFMALRDSGQCRMLTVPNGVVFNRMAYSNASGHHVRHDYKVALKGEDENPQALVCDLGDKFVGIVLKCGNPWRIDKPKAPPVAVAPVQATPVAAGCPPYRTVRIHVWTWEDLPHDVRDRAQPLIEAARARNDKSRPDPDVSNVLGGELRKRADAGQFARQGTITIDTFIVDERSRAEKLFTTVTVDRQASFEIPLGDIEGKTLRQIARDPNVISPTVWKRTGNKELWTYWVEWGKECTMNVHYVVSKGQLMS